MVLMHTGLYLIWLVGQCPLHCSNGCCCKRSIGEFQGTVDDILDNPSSFYIVDSKTPIPNAAAVTLEVSSPAHSKIHVGPVHHMLTMYFLVHVAIIFSNATSLSVTNQNDFQHNLLANTIRKLPLPPVTKFPCFPVGIREGCNGCILHANLHTKRAGSCQRMVPGCGSAANDGALQ